MGFTYSEEDMIEEQVVKMNHVVEYATSGVEYQLGDVLYKNTKPDSIFWDIVPFVVVGVRVSNGTPEVEVVPKYPSGNETPSEFICPYDYSKNKEDLNRKYLKQMEHHHKVLEGEIKRVAEEINAGNITKNTEE